MLFKPKRNSNPNQRRDKWRMARIKENAGGSHYRVSEYTTAVDGDAVCAYCGKKRCECVCERTDRVTREWREDR